MKISILSILLTVFIFSTVYSVDYKKKNHTDHDFSILDDVEVDIDDGTIILTDKETGDRVEITEDYELFVNGDYVKLSRNEQELVKDYYDLYYEIMDYAKRIGMEGARIGVEGAAIGVKAVAGVFKLLSADYDSEDLEAEIEAKAEELEEKAERLEDRAADIEDMAEELEDLHYQLGDEIEALHELKMFR